MAKKSQIDETPEGAIKIFERALDVLLESGINRVAANAPAKPEKNQPAGLFVFVPNVRLLNGRLMLDDE